MADAKISALNELTAPAVGDWFAIVDISADPDETKKITFANLLQDYFNTTTQDTTDITEGTDKNFVSDAELVVIGNTSGANTGDQSLTDYFDMTVNDTTDITEGTDKNFVSDAQLVVIGNTSGANTGDQSLPVKATGAEIDTGTDDAKFATPKAIEDSDLSFVSDAETLTNKKVQVGATPAADAFLGISVSLTADVNLTLGEICYVKSDGDMAKADASAIATSSAIAIATAAINADASGIFLLNGVIHVHTLAPAWTIGGLVYLSETEGDMTQTAPSATDSVIQILGVALAADILYFNPQTVQVEHT